MGVGTYAGITPKLLWGGQVCRGSLSIVNGSICTHPTPCLSSTTTSDTFFKGEILATLPWIPLHLFIKSLG